MSILGAATTTAPAAAAVSAAAEDAGNPFAILLIFVPLALVALWGAWRAGVFHKGSVVGPPRLAAGESLGVPLMLLGMAIFLFIVGQTVVVGVGRAAATQPATTAVTSAPSTAPAAPAPALSDQRLALLITWPPLIALALTTLGHAGLRPRGPRLLGLGLSQIPRGVVAGLAGSAIMIPLVYLVAQLFEILWRAAGFSHPTSHEMLYKMRNAPSLTVRYMLVAAAVLVAPLWEEFIFRGHLQTLAANALARYIDRRAEPRRALYVIQPGVESAAVEVLPIENPTPAARWVAIVFTSLCFAAIHVQPGPFPFWMMPPIFFLSLCVGYAYERTGNLWTTITMHACFNATSTILYFTFMR